MICLMCKNDKALEEFSIKKHTTGLYKHCDECRKKAVKIARKGARNSREKYGNGQTYKGRNNALLDLGFKNYQEYLHSDLWRSIKIKLDAKGQKQCSLCGADRQCWHHNLYTHKVLLGTRTKHIVPLCHKCHELIEFENGRKLPMIDACKKYKKLLRRKASLRKLLESI